MTTRRFLEQEVFKTESYQAIPLDQVIGKCCVMNVKDYFKMKPEGQTNEHFKNVLTFYRAQCT